MIIKLYNNDNNIMIMIMKIMIIIKIMIIPNTTFN
jgi:hypothetical protein